MTRRRTFLGAPIILATALMLGVLAAAPVQAGVAFHDRMSASLLGSNEVPPADPDGFGNARLQFFTSGGGADGMICWRIRVHNIALPATAAHIHEGIAGVNGPIVVTLSPPDATGVSQGCADVEPALFLAIGENPAGYYVNVHNADYPGGAVRGQIVN
jgi:hypothetical protein